MRRSHDINLELSRSWFVLAEISAVIAGLFMVAAGFTVTAPNDDPQTYMTAVNLCETILESSLNTDLNNSLEECLKDYGASYGKNIRNGNRSALFLLTISIVMTFDAFFLWAIGRRKIGEPTFSDVKKAVIIAIVNGVVLISAVVIYFLNLERPLG